MSTTFAALRTRISTVLSDPSLRTFTDDMVKELVYAGLTEVGALAPEQFTEDIDFVAGQLTYAVRSTDFDAVAIPEIELTRVEIWDPTQTPDRLITSINAAGTERTPADSGWSMWGGELTLPTRIIRGVEGYETTYVLRVWGYSPYVRPVDDSDVLAVSNDVEQAIISYAFLEALNQLVANRNLFTQWQTRSGNIDTTLAGLLNERNIARDEWRRKSRAITRLRARA